jgi:hypothetical protein
VLQLLAAERLRLEERQLPAVEGVAQLRVLVCGGKTDAQVARHRGAEGIEARRLAGRGCRGDRQHRTDPVRSPVEPLEEDGAGGDWSSSGEANRRHCVGQLTRRVGRVGRTARQRALELEHADPIRLAAEVPREQTCRLRPHGGKLPRGSDPYANAVAELDLGADREADEGRDGTVRVAFAVEGCLELLVGARERAVIPVESAATLGGADEERDEDAAIDGATFVSDVSFVRAGEDSRSRFAQQIRDGVLDIDACEQSLRARLDEAAHERAVLVERRATVGAVLLEREREVDAVLEVPREDREGAEAEAAECVV